jgi:hypothetical protein
MEKGLCSVRSPLCPMSRVSCSLLRDAVIAIAQGKLMHALDMKVARGGER